MLETILLILMILLAPIPWLVTIMHIFVLKNEKKVRLKSVLICLVLWAGAGYLAYELFPKLFTHQFNDPFLKVIGVVILVSALGIELATEKALGVCRIIGSTELKKTREKLITSGIYKYARHPRYIEHPLWFLGLGLVFGYTSLLWFALYLFLSLSIAAYFEEKELVQRYGRSYLAYKRKTPAFFITYKLSKQ